MFLQNSGSNIPRHHHDQPLSPQVGHHYQAGAPRERSPEAIHSRSLSPSHQFTFSHPQTMPHPHYITSINHHSLSPRNPKTSPVIVAMQGGIAPPSRTSPSPMKIGMRRETGRVLEEIKYEIVKTDGVRKLIDEKYIHESQEKNRVLRMENENLRKSLNETERIMSTSNLQKEEKYKWEMNEIRRQLEEALNEKKSQQTEVLVLTKDLEHWKRRLEVKEGIVQDIRNANLNLANDIINLKEELEKEYQYNTDLEIKLIQTGGIPLYELGELGENERKDIESIELEFKRKKDNLSNDPMFERPRKRIAEIEHVEKRELERQLEETLEGLKQSLMARKELEKLCAQQEEYIRQIGPSLDGDNLEFTEFNLNRESEQSQNRDRGNQVRLDKNSGIIKASSLLSDSLKEQERILKGAHQEGFIGSHDPQNKEKDDQISKNKNLITVGKESELLASLKKKMILKESSITEMKIKIDELLQSNRLLKESIHKNETTSSTLLNSLRILDEENQNQYRK